jgi:hypothetical protein
VGASRSGNGCVRWARSLIRHFHWRLLAFNLQPGDVRRWSVVTRQKREN